MVMSLLFRLWHRLYHLPCRTRQNCSRSKPSLSSRERTVKMKLSFSLRLASITCRRTSHHRNTSHFRSRVHVCTHTYRLTVVFMWRTNERLLAITHIQAVSLFTGPHTSTDPTLPSPMITCDGNPQSCRWTMLTPFCTQ